MLKAKHGLSFAVAAVSVLLLVACGDDSSSKVTEPAEVTTGTMTDSRDGQTYKTVTIGLQTWMAQNLNYETANSYCYDNEESNCTKYGRLYTGKVATTVCPDGWHLPTRGEFETLFTAVGGPSTAGKMLKSTSGWNDYRGESGNGSDAFAFSGLPAGCRYRDGYYHDEGESAYFWSSTEYHSYDAYNMGLYNMGLYYSLNGASLGTYDDKLSGYSVRCLKD